MPTTMKPTQVVLAAAVARRYFLEGKTKVEIADEFSISRFRVARILEEARDSGLVRIEIVLPAEIDSELSERLGVAFGLHHAITVRTSDEPEKSLRSHLGGVAAGLLTELVEEGDVLGMAWGRSLDALTSALKDLSLCTVVQLTGAACTVNVAEDSVELVRRVAAISGGPAYPIYAPLFVDTAEAAAALRRQPHVTEALRRLDRVTKAVVAIGSWDPPNSQLHAGLDNKAREALSHKHARAEVCGIFVDDDGHEVMAELRERAISISADQLRRVPEVIAVAGGRSKVKAILAVLNSGLITSLVTDSGAAEDLLAAAGPTPRSRTRSERADSPAAHRRR